MEKIIVIFVMGIVIEGLVSYVREWFVGGKISLPQVATVLLGVIVALVFNLDLFEIIGVTTAVPYIGMVLTGVFLSRGSNYFYEFYNKLINAGKDI